MIQSSPDKKGVVSNGKMYYDFQDFCPALSVPPAMTIVSWYQIPTEVTDRYC